MACKPLLSLCSIPKTAMRDGWAGSNAKLFLPFYGYWFASGVQLAFPQSTIPQDASLTLSGTRLPDNYRKDCCSCGPCGQSQGTIGSLPT